MEKEIMYTAKFVRDPELLLRKFPPKHVRIFAHHSTIAFKPKNVDGIEIGRKSLMKIIGRAYDEKGDALLVENPISENEYPHITLSCADNVPPFYSNELLKKASENNTIEHFDAPEEIEVIEGYFDGKNEVIEKK